MVAGEGSPSRYRLSGGPDGAASWAADAGSARGARPRIWGRPGPARPPKTLPAFIELIKCREPHGFWGWVWWAAAIGPILPCRPAGAALMDG